MACFSSPDQLVDRDRRPGFAGGAQRGNEVLWREGTAALAQRGVSDAREVVSFSE
jgi:hypothetical protein